MTVRFLKERMNSAEFKLIRKNTKSKRKIDDIGDSCKYSANLRTFLKKRGKNEIKIPANVIGFIDKF